MKKLKLKGKILSRSSGNFYTIGLEQENGYIIDLISRLQELSELNVNVPSSIQINYHITNQLLTEKELKELNILSISGSIMVELEKLEYRYSEYTSDVEFRTTLKVGNHDLYKELSGDVGKYVYFEINYK